MSKIKDVEIEKDKDTSEEYSKFLKNLQAEKEDISNFAKVLLLIVVAFCCLILFILIFAENEENINKLFGENSKISIFLLSFSKNNGDKHRVDFALPFMPRKQTLLLVGVDDNGSEKNPWAGSRTDTIILLNIDPKTKSINAISVPRDSKVYLPGDYGIQKINSAHAIGGINMTKETLERTLGIKIDNYIMVNDGAVKKIVDAIGGIPIYVEKNMFYNDYSGNLHINLSKGLNILDGNNAVGYLRFRKDGLGDIGRTQRQQWFLKGLLEKLQTPQTITKIPDILDAMTTYVKTDLSFYEISQYAALSKNFDIDKVEFATLPGSPNKRGAVSYWILDPDKTQEVVNRMIYRDKINASEQIYNVGIMYSYSKETEAEEIKSALEDFGYTINCYRQSKLPHSQFIANSSSVTNDFFNWLKKKTPILKNYQFIYNPNPVYCTDSDFTILLSDD